MDSNLEDTLEDEESMYSKLLQQKPDDTSGPESTSSRVSGSKVDLTTSCTQSGFNKLNFYGSRCGNEVEGTQEARERGHVIIAIDNPDPDLQVKIVVRTKRAVLLLV